MASNGKDARIRTSVFMSGAGPRLTSRHAVPIPLPSGAGARAAHAAGVTAQRTTAALVGVAYSDFRRTATYLPASQVTKHNLYNRPNAKKRRRSGWQPKHLRSISCLWATLWSEESLLPADQSPDADGAEQQKAAASKFPPAALGKDHRRQQLRRPHKSPLDTHLKASLASSAQALALSSGSGVPHL